MMRRMFSIGIPLRLAFVIGMMVGCSGTPDDDDTGEPSATGGKTSKRTGTTESGGSSAASGNSGQTGGTRSEASTDATAGTTNGSLGGGLNAAAGTQAASSATSGGASSVDTTTNSLGGASTGGTSTGGSNTGGTSTGGTSTGGTTGASAGASGKTNLSTGGTNTGGTNTGGTNTGGTSTANSGGIHQGGDAAQGGSSARGGTSPGGGPQMAGAAGRAYAGSPGIAGTAGVAGAPAVTCPPDARVLCSTSGGVSGIDSDCDGIADAIEIGNDPAHPRDTDGDGKPDYLDLDSDADGVRDNVEIGADCNAPADADSDGIADYRDVDADGNGIPDSGESKSDPDGDGLMDYVDLDDDGDLLPDTLELIGAPSSPIDTDHDGIPDFKDADADGDTISDRDERAGDPDLDGLPSYRDLDSDGDGIPDAVEAGDNNINTKPFDSDGDGLLDFVDLDSDGDGLLDAKEDLDHDGVVDPGESSRLKSDTDGDGVTDLIEVAAGTDPTNSADNPAAHGNFFFTEPYNGPPTPSRGTFDFATRISRADVFFLMDTTGSMSGAITNLKDSLSKTIIPALAAQIASVGIGIGSYRDFPTSTYGSAGDWPFALDHRIMTVTTAAGIASVQAKVNALVAGGGSDTPESSWEALHQIAMGIGNTTGGANVAAFNSATAYPSTAVPVESLGTLPGVGFRTGALPIITYITDAPGHNTDTVTITGSDYTGVTSPRSTQVISALRAMSARVIGVNADGIASGSQARLDQLSVVNATNTYVPPTAWGTGTSRPSGCGVTQCCTGISGVGEAANASGNCPLSFVVNTSGSGLGTAIVTAIQVLTSYGKINISARAVDDTSDSVNAVTAFVDGVVANPTAGAPCDTGLTASDLDGDGRLDTYVGVTPGKRVCFDVLPKVNTTVPPKPAPQMFKAAIEVVGDSVTVLDTRNVFFLVPPSPQ